MPGLAECAKHTAEMRHLVHVAWDDWYDVADQFRAYTICNQFAIVKPRVSEESSNNMILSFFIIVISEKK